VKESRIAIFASGSGTNAESIMTYFQGHENTRVVLLLTNNPGAFAIERARKFNVPAIIFTREQFKETSLVVKHLHEHDVTHIVLAGFLLLMPAQIINEFKDRIINIHPSLLPKYSGKGMYGMNVHQAVKSGLEKETGITIHLVNEHYDEGKILFQQSVEVKSEDSADDIANKVHLLEYEHFPRIIESFVRGE
jgi:phosphoribosylglycinamide formyltransferase 1